MTFASVVMASVLAPMNLTASVYGPEFHGRTQANGKPYNHHGVSFASRDHGLGTRLLVKFRNRSVEGVVTDRINARFKGKRIDLSGGAWAKLTGGAKPGLRRVVVEVVKQTS
jgi:rare lipoprotein A